MAAVKGVNMTKYDAGGSGDNYIAGGEHNTGVLCQMDSYEAAALASGSTIDIAELPEGAKIVGILLAFDALGTGVTLAVGDADDTDRYISAASAASLGNLNTLRVDGLKRAIGTSTNDSRIQVLTGGASATGTIKSIVLYTLL